MRTRDGGWTDASAALFGDTPPGRSLGLWVGRVGDDSRASVFVANDMSVNRFFTPDDVAGNVRPRWTETAATAGLANGPDGQIQGSMGIASSDWNRDGVVDFYVTNFERESNNVLTSAAGRRWNDDAAFRGEAARTGPLVGFGAAAVDWDRDGRDEIVVANGHIDRFADRDNAVRYAQPLDLVVPGPRWQRVSIGDGRYAAGGHVGRAVIRGDFDADGRVDVVVTHQDAAPRVLYNRTDGPDAHIIEIVGTRSGRTAIGTEIVSGASVGQPRRTAVDGGYLASHERTIDIGSDASSILVRWPDGRRESFALNVSSSRTVVVQGRGEPAEEIAQRPR